MNKDKLIFHLGHSAGFYSEFNNMVLAILYCKQHSIDFRLYSADANFGIRKGWRDYFLPFCAENKNPIHHFINHRFNVPKGGKRKLLYDTYKLLFPNTFLTSELWNQFRHIDNLELTTAEVKQLSYNIINGIYRFNPTTQQTIDKTIASLNVCEPFVGFHIRGGDKTAEHDIISVDNYIYRAEKESNIRNGFIYTDDYRFFETICEKYPQWHFFTLTPNEDKGYYHNEFMKLGSEAKAKKLIIMFASMELLCQANRTYCTFSSNIGMFLGMRIGDRAVGIDMDNWMIW